MTFPTEVYLQTGGDPSTHWQMQLFHDTLHLHCGIVGWQASRKDLGFQLRNKR